MQKKFWNKSESTNEIFIFGDITTDRFFDTDYTARQFAADLQSFGTSAIKIHINSAGGEIFTALTIAQLIKNAPNDIEVEIDGLCASAATIISSAAKTVSMAKNALMMIHLPFTYIGEATAPELYKVAEQLEKVKQSIIGEYVEKTGKGAAELEKLVEAETWLTAAEALELGFIDKIISPVEVEIDDKQKIAIFNKLPISGDDFYKIKAKAVKKAEDTTLIEKIKNLLNLSSTSTSKSEELDRIRALTAAKGKNLYSNAILDTAITSGANLSEVKKYIDAVEKVQATDTDKTASAILALIHDQLTSGAENITGSGGQLSVTKDQEQAQLIAKFLK